jgi:hypothetical protein
VVDVLALDRRVDLSRQECWLLYVWLGEDAPFVRNQLAVARNGGTRAVCISSHEEASQVLSALATGSSHAGALSDGLQSLSALLAADGLHEVR